MTNREYSFLFLGMLIQGVIGLLMLWAVSSSLHQQSDYWREAYCQAKGDIYVFCTAYEESDHEQ